MALPEQLQQATTVAELQPLIAQIPYARFLGFSVEGEGADLIGRMACGPEDYGNARIRAVHGGAIGALLELTATAQLLLLPGLVRMPKIINVTHEYLRGAQDTDFVLARAHITRHGRRVASVHVTAWVDNPDKPVAAANTHFLLAD
jgi:acyl-coenzyme A thioesterase PaaI-like protein